ANLLIHFLSSPPLLLHSFSPSLAVDRSSLANVLGMGNSVPNIINHDNPDDTGRIPNSVVGHSSDHHNPPQVMEKDGAAAAAAAVNSKSGIIRFVIDNTHQWSKSEGC
ncbi:hypothetical protein PENTCL1PPCAC_439, partial [Pristionchus entomophagus]